jgi:hypothetical protein
MPTITYKHTNIHISLSVIILVSVNLNIYCGWGGTDGCFMRLVAHLMTEVCVLIVQSLSPLLHHIVQHR